MLNKRQSSISGVSIVPAELIWPTNPACEGRFVARGICGVDDRPGFELHPIRTSLIENIDIKDGTIETQNTIYKII